MISCEFFYKSLLKQGFDFFVGVPDSLLKNFCFYIADHALPNQHIICTNEGSAVGLAMGHYLGSGNPAVVYLQNSGLGNATNPLLSLADKEVCGIPMLLLVGWRGEPSKDDEPQHIKQGRITAALLTVMEIPFKIIDADSFDLPLLSEAKKEMEKQQSPFVFLIRSQSFSDYAPQKLYTDEGFMKREEALENLLDVLTKDDAVVSTTGKTSRELYELRVSKKKLEVPVFLTVGAMGHSSQIALGLALSQKRRRVFCLDGDGALLMHLGGLTTIGRLSPENLIHIVLNNGAHESVGGQPTGALDLDLKLLAQTAKYRHAFSVASKRDLREVLSNLKSYKGPVFIEIKIKQGSRENLGRPKSSPLNNKVEFMEALKN